MFLNIPILPKSSIPAIWKEGELWSATRELQVQAVHHVGHAVYILRMKFLNKCRENYKRTLPRHCVKILVGKHVLGPLEQASDVFGNSSRRSVPQGFKRSSQASV
jgi:hypothetical protein